MKKLVEIPTNQVSFDCRLMEDKVTTNQFSQQRPRKSNGKYKNAENFCNDARAISFGTHP